MRYIAAAFVLGFCFGWFMRRRSKGGGDLPPLVVVVFYLFTQFVAASGGGNAGMRPLLEAMRLPARRAWIVEQQVSECRRHAFGGRVGEDTRTLKAFATFVRARLDVHVGASYAAMRWWRARRRGKA